MTVPAFAETLHIGLQSCDSDRKIFCRLSRPFTPFMTADVGVEGFPPVRVTASLAVLPASLQHEVLVQWGPEFFCVHMDSQLLAHAKVEGDNTRLIQLQSKIYV